ncbi:TIGR01777 family oxidoreductase [Nocardiopsis sp. RSe5-2]|uniref:TIGR01777 family oxidoreductase n=1 Tax=Nocardiopsis endophytica TaxID=3018445 RepID=A0ABT4UDE1_9ACTN|nr:TIGR01777 family oxidoreductase [Nocardiopsis endophytica]MDA2814370.1 TIGR01777 family oxidoreductase [Nocardiopsis endophytica]
MKVAITGSTGLIGSALARSLADDGHEVVRMVRRPARDEHEARWDPENGTVDTGPLVGADAVVHLAGAPLGPARWTTARRRAIRQSRVAGTRTLAKALAGMDAPPGRLLSGSAVGYYGDTGDRAVDETGDKGQGFLSDLCRDWERATAEAEEAGTATAHLRTGIALSGHGGLLAAVLPLFRLGLGGRLGDGRQYMSWISLRDHVGAMRFLLERPDLTGPFDLCAPEPVTNAAYTRAVAAAVGRPAPLPVPAFAMRAALGGFADEAALVSQRVLPARLQEAGFAFEHPTLGPALMAAVAEASER